MSNVVHMHAEPKPEEPAFMLCGCSDEGTPMLVQAMTGNEPFIMGLLCPECETYVAVVSGYIQTPK